MKNIRKYKKDWEIARGNRKAEYEAKTLHVDFQDTGATRAKKN